jgi:TRAP-type C4-dicarboxylate transport system permease small subunit
MTAKTINKFMFFSIAFTLFFTIIVIIRSFIGYHQAVVLEHIPLSWFSMTIIVSSILMFIQETIILILVLKKHIRLFNPTTDSFVEHPEKELLSE